MKRTKFQFSVLFVAVFLLIGFAVQSHAQVEKLQVHLFGLVNNDDARQIRRLLSPWVDAQNVNFHNAVDKNGRESLFTTVVEITPRENSSSMEIYEILRQLNDQRFRGISAQSQPWVVKTDAVVTGTLLAHAGWSRSYIRDVPFWRHWRGDTSMVQYALIAGNWNQKIVFSSNDAFDQLKREANQSDRPVDIKGQIAGFDGPYPILSVRQFNTMGESSPQNQSSEQE